MTSIASASLSIQTSSRSSPATPSWFGEVVLLIQHLRTQGVLDAIGAQVRFARRRFGRFEVIDFVAVLFGYALSGERTLQAFYERLRPWATAFMALFERDGVPSRSALSRFLATLDEAAVEALRAVFLADLLARRLTKEEPDAGLWDRAGTQWLVFDVDGTREAARQRALPQMADMPAAQRRLRPLCAPGYLGRKRGEAVRHLAGAYPSVARHLWQRGQRRLPRRTAPGSSGHSCLPQGPPGSTSARRSAPGWAVWHWHGARRSGGPGLCDAGPRRSFARPR
jgi:hypothetical protein